MITRSDETQSVQTEPSMLAILLVTLSAVVAFTTVSAAFLAPLLWH